MHNLFKDTLIYGFATIVSRGLSLLVLPIYTRMLAPADYGALDMITVAGSLATLIVALEIAQAVARFYGEADSESARRTMASTSLWFSVGAYALVLAVAMMGAKPLAAWLLGPAMETPFRIGAAFIAVNGIFYLMQTQLRVELRSMSYAVLSLLYAFATIGLGVLLGYGFDLGLNGVLWAQLLAAILSVLAGGWMLRERYRLAFHMPMLKELLHFSLPLVPSGLATFVTIYANRLLLNSMISLEAVGLFGVATRIASIIALLIVGLQSALTPLIYAHYREADTPPRLARIFEGFTAVALTCCLVLGLFAREILATFAHSSYATAGTFVMALAPATLFSQMYIFFPGIAIARKMHLQLIIFAITGVTSLLANWFLIKVFGLPGAVFATLLASGLFLILWIPMSQRLYPLPLRWRAIILSGVVFGGIALIGMMVLDANLPAVTSFLVRVVLLALFVASALWSRLIRTADIRLAGARICRLPGSVRQQP